MRTPSLVPTLSLMMLGLTSACGEKSSLTKQTTDAASPPGPAAPAPAYPYAVVEEKETLQAMGISRAVDVVRDDMGIPHIYAATLPDAAYAQGYFMARDRWLQMDFARRQAGGTLAEIVGALNPQAIVSDITYRTHHMLRTAEATFANLRSSAEADDKKIIAVLESFSGGVNAWQADLARGLYTLPAEIAPLYSPQSVTPWSPIDSLVLGELQAFQLSFEASSEIERSQIEIAERLEFSGSVDVERQRRSGFSEDYFRFAPFDPTYTVEGWAQATAQRLPGSSPMQQPIHRAARKMPLGGRTKLASALLERAARSLEGVGLDKLAFPDRGSNNWVIAPALSKSGHAMVANDTHLSLSNPAVFYLSHLTTADGFDAMGVQFPGIPLVILGMNQKLAWGSTVSYLDVTDVYQEQIADCTDGNGKCVRFKGADVRLTAREETFKVGALGVVSDSKTFTFYEVPHHGPILPNITERVIAPLKGAELSIRYTGYEPGRLLRAVYALNTAKTVSEGVQALERHFTHGGQNWVLADVAGDIAWTQSVHVPKRPKGIRPWAVLPGDGSAEWAGYWEPSELPRAKNPAKGYLVTANADPLGLTDDNDPNNEPIVNGFAKYMGYGYDPGTRASRITKRILEATAGSKKLDLDGMASIQGDAVTDFGRAFAPTFVAAVKALAEEAKTPGTHPEISSITRDAPPAVKAFFPAAAPLVQGWSFDTPAATESDAPTSAQIADSKATLMMAAWTGAFVRAILDDELATLRAPLYRSQALKLVAQLLRDPSKLKVGLALYDDLKTVEVESKEVTTAKSVVAALSDLFATVNNDADAWRWGSVHTVTPKFFAPVGLDLPVAARHGGDGTVDVASHGVSSNNFTFSSGAAIRFVCELDPVKGPIARNVIPGGEVFDPKSPHYADFFDLWKRNATTDLAFQAPDVIGRAQQELLKNQIGRTRFTP